MPLKGEVWKDVVGYEGLYKVSSAGRIKPVSPVVCKPVGRYKVFVDIPLNTHSGDGGGHLAVYLRGRGKPKRFYVHDLVLTAFVGPRPVVLGSRYEACHFPDRDPTNNHVENLRWDTSYGNKQDMKVHGTSLKGRLGPAGEANGMFGRQHTEEAKAKMRGRQFSEQHRANLRKAWATRKARSA